MQGCLETQIGLVTGGARGQTIPKSVRVALDAIRSSRGPRGKFKDAMERLSDNKKLKSDLELKRVSVFQLMEDLERNRRELTQATDAWDDDAHRLELNAERAARTVAAMRAAELESARNTATIALERARDARKRAVNRAVAVADLESLELALRQIEVEVAAASSAKSDAQASVEAYEAKLSKLRAKAIENAEQIRKLDRIREIVLLNAEINQHQETLDRAAKLGRELSDLAASIGAVAATDEAITRIEEAVTELSAAEAAMNAVATMVSFAIQEEAKDGILVDGKALTTTTESFPILRKTIVAIQGVGAITIEPQVKDRVALSGRLHTASEEMRAALEAAGVETLACARSAAARRKEYMRRSSEINREIANLASGNKSKKLEPGLEALEAHLSELRGRLQVELDKCDFEELPGENELTTDIQRNHAEGARLVAEIEAAGAQLAGPREVLVLADEALKRIRERIAELNGTISTKKADLDAGRASFSDDQLSINAEGLEREAAGKSKLLAEKERDQGESPEAINARIERLEVAATNHQHLVSRLGNELTRLTAFIQANEGTGVEELLLAADAEHDRLIDTVAEFEQEAAVLELLLETLESAEGEAKNRYLAPVVSRLAPYLKTLLPGSDIVLSEDLQIAAIQRGGQYEKFDVLSGGTKEQLAVLTRLAFAELLSGQGRPATVILDDALAFSDDDRIERMFDVLMRAGKSVQIIVLTCRKRLFTRLGAAPLEIRETA